MRPDSFTLPPKARLALYVATAVGSAIVAYLVAKGYIGDAETALWAGLVAVVNTLAATNVPSLRDVDADDATGELYADEAVNDSH